MSLAQPSMYFWNNSFASFGTPPFAAQAASKTAVVKSMDSVNRIANNFFSIVVTPFFLR